MSDGWNKFTKGQGRGWNRFRKNTESSDSNQFSDPPIHSEFAQTVLENIRRYKVTQSTDHKEPNSDGRKPPWKYDPENSAKIKAIIEDTCHERIGDKIEEAQRLGKAWRVASLQADAQREFDFMVRTNGECASVFADVRQAFEQYRQLEGYEPFDAKAELEKRFDVTTDSETGQLLIHPKGMKNITPAEMPPGWKPWGRGS